jgi:hypothetical protein
MLSSKNNLYLQEGEDAVAWFFEQVFSVLPNQGFYISLFFWKMSKVLCSSLSIRAEYQIFSEHNGAQQATQGMRWGITCEN